jgi:glycerol kinase
VKLRWMMDHVPEVKKAYEQDRLQFGTVDSWLIYVGILHSGNYFVFD